MNTIGSNQLPSVSLSLQQPTKVYAAPTTKLQQPESLGPAAVVELSQAAQANLDTVGQKAAFQLSDQDKSVLTKLIHTSASSGAVNHSQ